MPHTLPLRVAGKPHPRGSPTPRLSGPHSPVTVVACWALVECYTLQIFSRFQLNKKRLRTTSLSVIQQLSQLPLLNAIRYTTNRSIQSIYRVYYLTDAKYSAEVRPNFGTLSTPSAKTSASAEHCKGMFGAPLLPTLCALYSLIDD